MHKKVLLLSSILLVSIAELAAQQNPQFSQFMFNAPYWSVALTGADGKSSITAFSRNQWLGYESSFEQQGGAPTTQFINFTSPLTLLKTPLSLGANVLYDKLGPSSNIQVQIGLAYHWEFPRGTLSAGIRPSLNNRTIDFAELVFLNPLDERNTGARESQFAVDFDAGVAYTAENYTIGLGVGHLFRPVYDYGLADINGSNESLDVFYNLYGELRYPISYRFTLSPSALIQTDINSYTFSAGLVATYTEKIWGGFSYKNAESVVLLLGYSFLSDNALQLGYSFDYVINDREAKAQSSHELYVRYNLPSISTGTKKIIRTPRFRY